MTSTTSSLSAHGSTSRRRDDLLRRLDGEWAMLQRRPAAVARARTWHVDAEFDSLDELVAASGFFASAASRASAGGATEHHERVLAQLVRAAARDELAARVVLQRLLPGLIASARRWSGRVGDPGQALDEVVTAAWGAIRTFPEKLLSEQVAPRLLRSCEYQAFVKPTRRVWVQVPTEPSRLDQPVAEPAEAEPMLELAQLVAEARRSSLTDDDLRLLRLLVSGRTISDVAAQLDVSVRTVANHRSAMVHRLRQVALAA